MKKFKLVYEGAWNVVGFDVDLCHDVMYKLFPQLGESPCQETATLLVANKPFPNSVEVTISRPHDCHTFYMWAVSGIGGTPYFAGREHDVARLLCHIKKKSLQFLPKVMRFWISVE